MVHHIIGRRSSEGVWNRRGRFDGREEEVLRGKGRDNILPLRPCIIVMNVDQLSSKPWAAAGF